MPLFITISGGEVYETLSLLTTPDLPRQKKFSEMMSLLKDHFSPRLSKKSERGKFHNGENVKEYSIRLQEIAHSCNLGDFLETDSTKDVLQYKRWALDKQMTDKSWVCMPKRRVMY